MSKNVRIKTEMRMKKERHIKKTKIRSEWHNKKKRSEWNIKEKRSEWNIMKTKKVRTEY